MTKSEDIAVPILEQIATRASARSESKRAGWRQQVVRIGFRFCLFVHAIALRILGLFPAPALCQRPRRILLTGTFFSENWILNHLIPLTLSRGCEEVIVVTSFPIPKTPKVTCVGPPRKLSRVIGGTLARLLTYLWIAVVKRPDVVGGFHLIPNGLFAAIVARIVRAESLHFCGGGPREVLGGGILGNRALECVDSPDFVAEGRLLNAMSYLTHVICMGKRSVRYYQSKGVRSKFHVIPGGIDLGRFNPVEAPKEFDLIFVGRLVAVKRVDLYLEAVCALAKNMPQIRAVVVGTGELELSLREQARALGIADNVHFAGHQSDVVTWLRKSRVFVLTSDSEGLSLAMMEAMTCGLPCVVSDVGELGEVIEPGHNGYLIAERAGLAFADCIRPMLQDATKFHQFAAAAERSGAAFSIAAAVKEWDVIFSTEIARRASHLEDSFFETSEGNG